MTGEELLRKMLIALAKDTNCSKCSASHEECDQCTKHMAAALGPVVALLRQRGADLIEVSAEEERKADSLFIATEQRNEMERERDGARYWAMAKNAKFIAHIQAHLAPGESVICKICGKTAEEICGMRHHPHGTGPKAQSAASADTVAPQYPGFPQEADRKPTPPAPYPGVEDFSRNGGAPDPRGEPEKSEECHCYPLGTGFRRGRCINCGGLQPEHLLPQLTPEEKAACDAFDIKRVTGKPAPSQPAGKCIAPTFEEAVAAVDATIAANPLQLDDEPAGKCGCEK